MGSNLKLLNIKGLRLPNAPGIPLTRASGAGYPAQRLKSATESSPRSLWAVRAADAAALLLASTLRT